MRRPALLISSLLVFMISSYGQKNEVRFLIDTTISIMRENSVNASKVDWVKVKQEVHGSFFYKDSTRQAGQLPIVILTGAQTGSSGEFLIMTFKGRPNTILLGATTAGYVTVNNGFQISDSAAMNLSIGYGADRNGTVYTEALRPDIFIDGPDSFNDLANDVKVKAAIKWLKKQ